MYAVTGLPIAVEPHGDTGAGTGRGRMRAQAREPRPAPPPACPAPAPGRPTRPLSSRPSHPSILPAPHSSHAPHRPRPLARPARSPADQSGDDDAPGGAAAVGVQVLLALAPPAAQPEGVDEQEEEVQGEAGQRGRPQQQQRLREVGKWCWRCGPPPWLCTQLQYQRIPPAPGPRDRRALPLNPPPALGIEAPSTWVMCLWSPRLRTRDSGPLTHVFTPRHQDSKPHLEGPGGQNHGIPSPNPAQALCAPHGSPPPPGPQSPRHISLNRDSGPGAVRRCWRGTLGRASTVANWPRGQGRPLLSLSLSFPFVNRG